ncbi:exopolyphosphatase PRUNE1 isoform X2 [Cygnus atratus]|uniref:exopolyphosphatase PRUNE1 isoform X2 n=1 Tax=Cygnus atratus TaxID=8868 RepID=UPI0015D586D6|nr:exopolyphosphatase PRUNE1 isoform X2 [Cygnus atratus]
MERFVEGRRAALQENIQCHQEVHVVMGNEACDLDSAVSALALAYFLAKTSSPPKAAFIPVLNIPRSDFALRTETTFLLREQGIAETSLIFRDEIDLARLHQAGLLSLTLVDHHVLPSTDAALEEAIVDVLDHRPLERVPSCQFTVELVGSCATLVTERIAQGPPGVLDRTTAALLHGTILLDSVNLNPAAGKVTPRDVACISLLESRFPELPAHNTIYEALQAAKFDVSELTTEQMLQKDLKTLSNDELVLAISGIYINLEVCQVLEEATVPCLHLQPLPSPWSCVSIYTQGNALASRKKVLPILRAALGGLGAMAGLEEDTAPPPTPMNSLVDESPLAQAVPPLCPQAVLERVSRMAAEQPPDPDK